MSGAGYGTVEGPSGGADGARGADVEQAVRAGARSGEALAARSASVGEGPREPEWHANGTVVGLVIDVGSTFGYYMFLLLTMFFGLEVNKSRLLSCTIGPGKLEFRTLPEAYICEYTKSHLLVFPMLSVSVVLIYMGRDLLQKRLYYGLLRNGGVMDFAQNKPFKDSLVLLLIVNYLHVVGHLVLMYWIAYDGGEGAVAYYARVGAAWPGGREVDTISKRIFAENVFAESEHIRGLGFLWGAVMIPGTLVIAFVFLGYDIDKTLVPLSQYVHGLEEFRRADQMLSSLHVFRDVCAKKVVEDPSGPVAAASGSDLDTQYRAVVEAACLVPRKVEDESPSLALQQSLWPVALLLRSNTPDADARTFRWLWLGMASSAIGMMVFALMTLGPTLVKDTTHAVGAGHHQFFAQVPTLVCSLAIVSTIVRDFACTFWSHAPVKRRSVREAHESSLDALSPGCAGTAAPAPPVAGTCNTDSDKTK